MRRVNLDHTGCQRSRIDDLLHRLLRRLQRSIRHGLAEVEVIHDDMHASAP